MLHGQCVLSCSFERHNHQCAPLVDQFAHLFAAEVKFARFYTHANFLLYEALRVWISCKKNPCHTDINKVDRVDAKFTVYTLCVMMWGNGRKTFFYHRHFCKFTQKFKSLGIKWHMQLSSSHAVCIQCILELDENINCWGRQIFFIYTSASLVHWFIWGERHIFLICTFHSCERNSQDSSDSGKAVVQFFGWFVWLVFFGRDQRCFEQEAQFIPDKLLSLLTTWISLRSGLVDRMGQQFFRMGYFHRSLEILIIDEVGAGEL